MCFLKLYETNWSGRSRSLAFWCPSNSGILLTVCSNLAYTLHFSMWLCFFYIFIGHFLDEVFISFSWKWIHHLPNESEKWCCCGCGPFNHLLSCHTPFIFSCGFVFFLHFYWPFFVWSINFLFLETDSSHAKLFSFIGNGSKRMKLGYRRDFGFGVN